MKPAGNDSRV